jgi:hypothetical protein
LKLGEDGGKAQLGLVRRVKARRSEVWMGMVRSGVWWGEARLGKARTGMARFGKVR